MNTYFIFATLTFAFIFMEVESAGLDDVIAKIDGGQCKPSAQWNQGELNNENLISLCKSKNGYQNDDLDTKEACLCKFKVASGTDKVSQNFVEGIKCTESDDDEMYSTYILLAGSQWLAVTDMWAREVSKL